MTQRSKVVLVNSKQTQALFPGGPRMEGTGFRPPAAITNLCRVVISQLFARNCCDLAVVGSATITSQLARQRSRQTVIGRSLGLWRPDCDTRKSYFRGCCSFHVLFRIAPMFFEDRSKNQKKVFIDSDNLKELNELFDIVKTRVGMLVVFPDKAHPRQAMVRR